ncbi:unnamed protein product, partial [Ectocarpus fasciculatus]
MAPLIPPGISKAGTAVPIKPWPHPPCSNQRPRRRQVPHRTAVSLYASSLPPSDVCLTGKQIQVLVLYTNMSLDLMSVSDIQMETMVSAALSTVNVGFDNSNIGIDTTTVYQGRVSC